MIYLCRANLRRTSGNLTYFLISVWTGPISTGDTKNYDSSLFKTLTEDKDIVITVRAKNDAHLGFFSESQDKFYEIVIGGWTNTKTVLRRVIPSEVDYNETATPNILNPNEDRPFWADVKNGLMRLGSGNVVGNDIILKWQDNQPLDPSYVGFMTGWGSSGIWKYKGTKDPTTTTATTTTATTTTTTAGKYSTLNFKHS